MVALSCWEIEREVIKVSLSAAIESIEREMFDRATKRNCGNCKWWADNEVCVNGDSEQVADFTNKGFCCNCHEFKEVPK